MGGLPLAKKVNPCSPMFSGRHIKINYTMGYITLLSGRRFFSKNNSGNKLTCNMVCSRLVLVHECVHELKEHLQQIYYPLFITHIVR